jgi:hypothetical protein
VGVDYGTVIDHQSGSIQIDNTLGLHSIGLFASDRNAKLPHALVALIFVLLGI